MTRAAGIVLLGLAAIAATPNPANACSCVGGIPLCESFWKTPAVFSGEVLDISDASEPPTTPESFRGRLVRLRVDRSFRGEVSGEVVVRTGSGGGDCGYTFIRGVSYLVYATVHQGVLHTNICQRTRPMSDAAEDLAYLKTAFAPRATGEVFGRVTYRRKTFEDPEIPIAGYTVSVSGAQRTWKATTDADGRYAFKDVPAGKYTAKLDVPETEHVFGGGPVELRDPRGCAASNFSVIPDGRISIRVIDTAGRPVRGVQLELVPLESLAQKDRFPLTQFAQTEPDGRAEWRQIAPGSYVVGLNVTRAPDAKQPFPSTFYPGVADAASARSIDLVAGERVELETFALPEALTARTIAGVVLSGDGTPAARARVTVGRIVNDRELVLHVVTSDDEGRFSTGGYIGQHYVLTAFSQDRPAARRQVKSRPFELTPDTGPITLTLPR